MTRMGEPAAEPDIRRYYEDTYQGGVTAANFPGLLEAYATGRNDGRSGFTTAYFHSPSELADDVTAAGLGRPQVFGIEGPLWPALDAVGARLTERVRRAGR
jgi:hypothetical protein